MQNFNSYNVDIVLCIDKTGSMEYILDEIKSRALDFHKLLEREMINKQHKTIGCLRIKVIAFGCIGEDQGKAFKISDFFELPNDEGDFKRFVNDITLEGGGDESGLNALACAMQSNWNKGKFMRQIIVMFTDEDSHPLELHYGSQYCPSRAPRRMADLDDMWCGLQTSNMNPRFKRLVMFAPNNTVYSDIKDRWDRVYFYPQEYGKLEMNMEDIVAIIAASIK